ncbi:flavodoxin [Carnobacteriaceae bacterium zg-ZUI252]|nr:flavodoxin [Carnobacteriaceae bacterium zg-ZUI252]
MPSALIVYASLTGSTEECADIVAENLEDLGYEVDVVDSIQASASHFSSYDVCIVGSYSCGDNTVPDDILDFYEELADETLTGKIFGVFGSGDRYYGDNYCCAVKLFDKRFEAVGATRGSEYVMIELSADEEDIERLENFVSNIDQMYHASH